MSVRTRNPVGEERPARGHLDPAPCPWDRRDLPGAAQPAWGCLGPAPHLWGLLPGVTSYCPWLDPGGKGSVGDSQTSQRPVLLRGHLVVTKLFFK